MTDTRKSIMRTEGTISSEENPYKSTEVDNSRTIENSRGSRIKNKYQTA